MADCGSKLWPSMDKSFAVTVCMFPHNYIFHYTLFILLYKEKGTKNTCSCSVSQHVSNFVALKYFHMYFFTTTCQRISKCKQQVTASTDLTEVQLNSCPA